jgi:rubrerythrin
MPDTNLMPKREFASLNPQEALHVAIFIEERNAQLYGQFSELFSEFGDSESVEIAATFDEMAAEERKHGSLLQKRYFDRYGTQACAVTEDDVRELIEVPRLEEAIFVISRAKGGRSPRELALEVGLNAEQSATRYYSRLLEMSIDPEMRAFYREFVDFETGHTDFLQRTLDSLRRAAAADIKRH